MLCRRSTQAITTRFEIAIDRRYGCGVVVLAGGATVDAAAGVVACCSHEGMVMKLCNSLYVCNDRTDAWVKLKPEYMEGVSETLDVVIVGGYLGEGSVGLVVQRVCVSVMCVACARVLVAPGVSRRRLVPTDCVWGQRGRLGRSISHFLLAVADRRPEEGAPTASAPVSAKFCVFCKVPLRRCRCHCYRRRRRVVVLLFIVRTRSSAVSWTTSPLHLYACAGRHWIRSGRAGAAAEAA
jgi:hypothetical protein